jgi:L-aspartate oxidase
VEAIRDGREGAEATGVLRGIAGRPPFRAEALEPIPMAIATGPSIREELQRIMTRGAGVVRSAESLERTATRLATMTATDIESANLLTVSTALVRAATTRRESRGTHTRADYPEPSNEFLGHLVFADGPTPGFVPLAASEPV